MRLLAMGMLVSVAVLSISTRGWGDDAIIISPTEALKRADDVQDRLPLGPVQDKRRLGTNSTQWSFIGPQPLDYGPYVSGAYPVSGGYATGRICSIAIDPRNGNVAYAAAAGGGVWKTTNHGATWLPMTDALSSLSSGCVALDPVHPDVVYYATGEQNFAGDCLPGDGLFRSEDGGTTWSKIAANTSVGKLISRVSVSPADPNIILIGSERGLLRSTNRGSTFTVVLNPTDINGTTYCTDLAFSPSAPGTAWAAMRGVGVYKSTDAGATWIGSVAPGVFGEFGRINLAVAPSDPLTVYASASSTRSADNGRLHSFFKTVDGGTSWFYLPNTPDYLRSTTSNHGQGDYDNCVVVHPTDPNVVLAGGCAPGQGWPSYDWKGSVIRSDDGGSSWYGVGLDSYGYLLHPDQHALAFGPDFVLWLGGDAGVWTTSDTYHWTNCNASLGTAQFYRVAVAGAGSTRIVGGLQDNGTAVWDGTSKWSVAPDIGDGASCAIDQTSAATFYSTTFGPSRLEQWNNYSLLGIISGDWNSDAADALSPLVVDPNDHNTLWYATDRVWERNNQSGVWTSFYLYYIPVPIAALGFGVAFPYGSYAGTTTGHFFAWSDTSAYVLDRGFPVITPIRDIVVSPSDWHVAYVCAESASGVRVFRTADAGVTFTNATGDLPASTNTRALAVDFRVTPPSLYVGTDHGVYFSVDNGAHWTLTNLPSVAVYDLVVDTFRDVLVAATHGRGMWKLPLSITSAQGTTQAADSRPDRLSLTLETRTASWDLSLRVPAASLVTVEVVDVAGRHIATLSDDTMQPGQHDLRWSGKTDAGQQAASGVYLVRASAGKAKIVRRGVFVR